LIIKVQTKTLDFESFICYTPSLSKFNKSQEESVNTKKGTYDLVVNYIIQGYYEE